MTGDAVSRSISLYPTTWRHIQEDGKRTEQFSGTTFKVCAMKAYWESRGMTPHIFKLGTRWRRVVNITPWSLNPEKLPQYQLNRRLVGPNSRSGRFGEDKNLLHPAGFESRVVQSVPTRLSRSFEFSGITDKNSKRDSITSDFPPGFQERNNVFGCEELSQT
jgi:hypothetical protein